MSKNTAIVFPGQGSQVVGMGKELYDEFECAREVFGVVDDILGIKLSQIMFEGPIDELTKTQNTQPALMAVSIALMRVIEKEFGKKINDLASYSAGHSLGEYSALCASGAITLEDAARLLQIRGGVMAECGEKNKGSMAAIIGSEINVVRQIVQEASQFGICQIANDNSVGQIVISGGEVAIKKAILIAKEKGAKRALELPVSGAFHSELMLEAATKMKAGLENVKIENPAIPVIANVTANIVQDSKEIKDLLVKQITGSVRWRETMLFMESKGIKEVVEIGSGKVLSGLVGRTCKQVSSKSIQNIKDIRSWLD